ncbi:MAG: CBS domain-containing protein [Rhodospirillales bacterium]|nr:MAG: CBS domain-containing protein [Rhodospirillales bacterium]
MNSMPLARLDSFPYRHRVREVMSAPLELVEPEMTLGAASRLMVDKKVSSLVALDGTGRAAGIITERDVLRAMARDSADAATDRVGSFLSSPVLEIRSDAFVYKALGRMMRHGVRHLVAVEPVTRQAVGMVTGRALLKLRSGDMVQLGDTLNQAQDAAGMAAVRAELPGVVRAMLAEGVGVLNAAAVISQVYCDMTRRAAELAGAAMEAEGRGPAPAAWALLVLGSGGRGESLLAPDQDNAIVHLGSEADDAWFADLGQRVNDLLDAAGIPYCKGKVMAGKPAWRRSLAGWEEEILSWLRSLEFEPLLMVHIFFDFVAVHGDFELAEQLRRMAVDLASRAPLFLRRMAVQIEDHRAPLTLFGRFKTQEGRVDLKLGGQLPITSGARTMALRLGSLATSTSERLQAVQEAGIVTADDMDSLCDAYKLVTRTILDQQLADIEAGREPSSRVNPKRLPRRLRQRLKEALRTLEGLPTITRDAVSSSVSG